MPGAVLQIEVWDHGLCAIDSQGTVRVWHANWRETDVSISFHLEKVSFAYYSEKGLYLVANGDLHILDLVSLHLSVLHRDNVICVTTTSAFLAVGKQNGFSLFDQDGKELAHFKSPSPIMAIAIGEGLIAIESSGQAHMVDIETLTRSFFDAGHGHSITSAQHHSYVPLTAIGTEDQAIRIFKSNVQLGNSLRHHSGWLGSKLGQVKCVRWHPRKVQLAIASGEGTISVYTSKDLK